MDPAFRMGLFAVDKNDTTKARTPRKSVAAYASIIDAHGIPKDLTAMFPTPR
jgi:beta-glucosidase/6-phospho-beta-glucosidase/beta-galactosidase